jgi:hypothetical protein
LTLTPSSGSEPFDDPPRPAASFLIPRELWPAAVRRGDAFDDQQDPAGEIEITDLVRYVTAESEPLGMKVK